MGIEVTEEEVLEWVKMNEDLSITEIATKTGRNHKTIRKYFDNIGFKAKSHMYRKVNKADFFREYEVYINTPNYSFLQFAKNIGIARQNLEKKFKRYNLKTKTRYEVVHLQVNEDFFEKIDSEIKAYLLGFFAADGHIEKRRDYDTYCLKIGIHKKDVEILELYNKYVANNLCRILFPKTKPTMCTLSIHSTKIGIDLLKLGYDNRKTYTSGGLPKIPDNMIRHFIRGYFDGDGSVMVNHRKAGEWNFAVNFCAFREKILSEIFLKFNITQNKVYKTLTGEVTRKVNNRDAFFKGACTYEIKDYCNFKLIFDYMYKDANFFLERKYEKFKLGVNIIDSKAKEKMRNIKSK